MKKFIIFLSSRFIKIFANITKLGCYVFHFFFPKKRFTLPKHAKPLFNNNTKSAIPKTLWQTNYTSSVTVAVYINYLFNRLLSYNYEYRFMSTKDRTDFIKSNCSPEVYDSYSKIQIGAAQADFWRLIILNKFGGVYMDIDAHLIWSLNSIIKSNQEELYLLVKNDEISNYFIASKPDNSNLEKMIQLIIKNIHQNQIKNIYDLTGPKIFNQILDISTIDTINYKYTCDQGNFTNSFFQYIDKPEGKWTKEQKIKSIIR